MECPICRSKNVRLYYVDEMLNELSPTEVEQLTYHEKELAAQCTCEDCSYTDAAEYFKSLFETFSDMLRPC